MINKTLVYTTEKYGYFVPDKSEADRRALNHFNLTHQNVERTVFPDGEIHHEFPSNNGVRGQNVVVIGGTVDDAETMELYDIASGLAERDVKRITLIIPYFGYSTMERAVKKGEIVKAKNRARLLSSIPSGRLNNRIMFLDLHSEGIPYYIEGNTHVEHVYAKKFVMDACARIADASTLVLHKDFVIGSTDAGRAKWVESLAHDMDMEYAVVIKRRVSGSETHTLGINADVSEKRVIIYDDMIRTGGSLLRAAEAYKKAGAKEIYMIATHGVFPDESCQKILADGLIKKLIVTNSHPKANSLFALPKLEVHDIQHLFFDKLLEYEKEE